MKLINSLALLLMPFVAPVIQAADTAAWKSRNIYFVLTDRIARNANDQGGNACSNLGDYCGGTFKGLESKLDYIKGMGFDAVWITPVVANSPGAYHGYHAKDLYTINSKYGSADDLKALVNTAHSKGMYIMIDVVANHMGPGNIGDNKPDPLNQQSSYHTDCDINYNDQNSIEVCRIAGLPDVKTEDDGIKKLYQTWVNWLVNEFKFDGLRIDTVKHVEKEFWPGFVSAAGVYAVGEVFNGDPDYLAGYTKTMPGLLNYAIYYPLNRFYQQQGSSQDLVDMHNEVSSKFPDPSAMGTFLDNHDNPRWLHQKNDVTLFKNALAYVILSRGIPIVYYGSEQGYAGGDDPANREDLWRSNFNTSSDLYSFISRVSGARKAVGGLAQDDHVHLYVSGDSYAWSRAGGDLVVLTTNGGSSKNGETCFGSQAPNKSWDDIVGSGSYKSDGSGKVCVQVKNGLPVVLVANK